MPQPLRTETTAETEAKTEATVVAEVISLNPGSTLTQEEQESPFEAVRKRAEAAAAAGDPLLLQLLNKHGDAAEAIQAYGRAGRVRAGSVDLPTIPQPAKKEESHA